MLVHAFKHRYVIKVNSAKQNSRQDNIRRRALHLDRRRIFADRWENLLQNGPRTFRIILVQNLLAKIYQRLQQAYIMHDERAFGGLFWGARVACGLLETGGVFEAENVQNHEEENVVKLALVDEGLGGGGVDRAE